MWFKNSRPSLAKPSSHRYFLPAIAMLAAGSLAGNAHAAVSGTHVGVFTGDWWEYAPYYGDGGLGISASAVNEGHLFPTWLALVSMRGISPWLLLVVMAAVWIADSTAYFAGRRFGKHKLAPQISPGKTWEGVLGAWLGVSLYGVILCYSLSLSYWTIVGLLGITVLSIMGDLLESLVKRQAGVKDSGSLLPGHGGVLDRIDGLTSTLPLVMFFIYFPTYFLVMESFYA